jgi:hypothetical protein
LSPFSAALIHFNIILATRHESTIIPDAAYRWREFYFNSILGKSGLPWADTCGGEFSNCGFGTLEPFFAVWVEIIHFNIIPK